jgi:glyoxylase-like metal-dependent hydrolase (beta-lactamase superfamily II)
VAPCSAWCRKPLWEKRTPANERNQILLGTNTVVVRTGKHTVVIETGIGNKLPEKLRSIFDARQLLPQSFHAARDRPEEVDIVINTHLHFDHCGWNTTQRKMAASCPRFPTPATSRIAEKWSTAICSWSAMPSAISARTTIRSSPAGR